MLISSNVTIWSQKTYILFPKMFPKMLTDQEKKKGGRFRSIYAFCILEGQTVYPGGYNGSPKALRDKDCGAMAHCQFLSQLRKLMALEGFTAICTISGSEAV